MDKFIAEQNVTHFRNELENGADGPRRSTLLKLLVEEENRLGLTRQQLEEMERQIERIKLVMAEQTETVALLKANGHPVEKAEKSLANLADLVIVHDERRKKIAAALLGRHAPS